MQLQEQFKWLQERLNQIRTVANTPAHIEELALLTNKLQKLALTLHSHPTNRPVDEPIHPAIQQYTDICVLYNGKQTSQNPSYRILPHLTIEMPSSYRTGVSFSLLGGQLVGYMYNNIRPNLWITINYYKLSNAIAAMVLKCMKLISPSYRKPIHVWKSRKKCQNMD